MVVISVSFLESTEQLVSGFPTSISISVNVPATIFFTTDGSIPTTMSNIYVGPIVLPLGIQEFALQAFATNGIDSSPVITHTYQTNILNNSRLPHAAVTDTGNNTPVSLFPFGSNTPDPNVQFLNPAFSGTTVDNAAIPNVNYGFDANGNPVGSDQPIDTYLNVYSTTNAKGQNLPNVGNLPGKVDIIGRRSILEYHPEDSSRTSALFNPKAKVIFQDASTDDPTNPPQINPQRFSLENQEIYKDGADLRASGLDIPSTTGSYLRSHFNPRTQTITNYYRDSGTDRWIISSFPHEPRFEAAANLSGMVFSRNDQGAGRVYRWNLFRYSRLT